MTKNIEGKERFTEELERMKTVQMSKLILHQVVSHGKEGAVNGIMKMLDGRQYAFSDFYRFTGAKGTKIKSITSYVIGV